MSRILLCVLVGMMAFGCGDDDGSNDSGAGNFDAGRVQDTGSSPDTSVFDAGPTPEDTGAVPDTGLTFDAGGGGMRGEMCPAAQACNVVNGIGCMAEEGCFLARLPDSEDAAAMCAMAGTGAIGTTCMAANACAPGLNCIGGECRAMCCGGEDGDCPEGGRCGGRTSIDGIGFCLVADDCDMLAQTGCDEGEGCYPLSAEGGTICGSAGTIVDGAACTSANDCVPGSLCLGDGFCHSLCTPESTDECPAESTCGGLTGFDGVGVCSTPAA